MLYRNHSILTNIKTCSKYEEWFLFATFYCASNFWTDLSFETKMFICSALYKEKELPRSMIEMIYIAYSIYKNNANKKYLGKAIKSNWDYTLMYSGKYRSGNTQGKTTVIIFLQGCGKVYCDTCCQYRRRLSPECIPDPQGNIYRVCYYCADLTVQPLGEVRSHTNLFHEQRKNKRMTLSDELKRLTDGFEENINPQSRLKTALSDTFSVMKVPEWQKSSKWLESSEVEWCTKCSAKFSLFNIKHHCRLCGSVFCNLCCKSHLLLYFDDDGRGSAKLINVVGCPDNEPPICLYLAICLLCEEDLEEYQVQQYHLIETEKDCPKGNLKDVGGVLDRLRIIEKKLEASLPRFQELVESYVFEGKTNENITGQNNVEFFAKLQGDISDLFTEYAVVIQGLKKFEMSTKTELRVMRNIVNVKCKHYNHGMMMFKNLKDNLDKSLPAKALHQFQSYANMQAINNTYVMTRQLGFEALNLATKFGFDTLLAEKLSNVDQVCFIELKTFVEHSSEDWDEHLDVLNTFLKQQIKHKKLVSPNGKLALKDGRRYVRHFLIERSCTILYQVLRALKAKSSDKQFLQSKESLQTLLNMVAETNVKQGRYKPPPSNPQQ